MIYVVFGQATLGHWQNNLFSYRYFFFLFYLHHNADYIFFPLLVTLMWLLKNQFFSIDLYIQSLIFTDINICSYIILDGGIDNASINPSYACIEMHILNDPYSNF